MRRNLLAKVSSKMKEKNAKTLLAAGRGRKNEGKSVSCVFNLALAICGKNQRKHC